MDARGLEARMEMIVQEILADETQEMDLSLRLGLDNDKGAVSHVGPIRSTARPTSLWSPYSRGVPDVNFRHYPHQLNASRSLGPWARIVERGPAATLQQRIGQLSIGGGSEGHPGANPFPRQARLGNFLAPLPPPLPPAVSNVLGGTPPIFPGYPALPPLVAVNRNSNIPSLDMSPARQYLQEMMANVDASSSHNNANNNNNNNNVNYSEWSGFMMGRGHENNGQGERPVKRCSNSRCNTAETPMWRRGPLGPKSLCNACGIKFRKEEERRQASEEAAAASSSMASQWLPPHFLM